MKTVMFLIVALVISLTVFQHRTFCGCGDGCECGPVCECK